MQAIAKAVVPEFARGVATSFIVWAGRTQCSCVCPSCPDCVCKGGYERECVVNGISVPQLVVAVLVSVLFGIIIGRSLPTQAVRARREREPPPSFPPLDEVQQQLAELRRRNAANSRKLVDRPV